MNESFIGTETDLKGSRSAGATLIAKLPPSLIIFEAFRPTQFRFLIKQLTGQHHRRHPSSVSHIHAHVLLSVSSLVSCSFPALPAHKADRVCFERPFSRSRWVDTDQPLWFTPLLWCQTESDFCRALPLLILFLLLCANCKPTLPPRLSVTVINTASSVLIADNAFTASANED